ncbi:MAG: hypothetical protein H6Q85_2834 [candidate division NC10 bacterium]|nr:hypothetical protein [candidate division NC10 bacterium]
MGVEAVGVHRQKPYPRVLKEPLGSRREIAQSRADPDHEVGRACDGVGRRRARHPDPAEVPRTVPGQGALAGLGLGERDVELRAERLQRSLGARIPNAAPADHQGLLHGGDERRRPLHLPGRRSAANDVVDALPQELFRIVVRFPLHILREGQRDRAGLGRIREHAHGVDAGAHELFRARDPIPVPAHRLERVVGRHVGVEELLHLLEDRIGLPAGEDVSGKEEHRDAVHRGGPGSRDHVERPRSDGAGDGEDLPAPHLLGVGDGRVRHALLVVPLVIGQAVRAVDQRLAEADDISVAEDAEHSTDELVLATIDVEVLVVEKPHERLRHGQSHCLHRAATSLTGEDDGSGKTT